MPRFLTTDQARAFYDRFGSRLDRQGFYEDPALHDLLVHGEFGTARGVFELGCGTGRFAARLLAGAVPADCRYLGVDISPTMLSLAEGRLRPWAPRAEVRPWSSGAKAPAGPFDRFVSTYVLDLLAPDAVGDTLRMAHAMLEPDGRLCVAGLTEGERGLARIVSGAWKWVHALRPEWVGGCRPLRLLGYLRDGNWQVEHHRIITAWGVSSEVVVARPREAR
jgi:SAM-dependent methyltransferase